MTIEITQMTYYNGSCLQRVHQGSRKHPCHLPEVKEHLCGNLLSAYSTASTNIFTALTLPFVIVSHSFSFISCPFFQFCQSIVEFVIALKLCVI